MNEFVCCRCLFAEEFGSSDLIRCIFYDELRKINEPACSKFKGGFYEKRQDIFS